MDRAKEWVDTKKNEGDTHEYHCDGPYTAPESNMIFSPPGTFAVSVEAGMGILSVGNNPYHAKYGSCIKLTDGWDCTGHNGITLVWIIRK